MSPAKAWFDKLTTLRKIEGQRRQGSENSKNLLNVAPWRSFDSAQDMLGGINFPGVVLFNISKVSIA